MELSVRGRRVVVTAADARAAVRVAALVDEGADVLVLADEAVATIDDLAARGLITWERRDPTADDLVGAALLIGVEAAVSTSSRGRVGERTGTVTLVGGGPGDPGLVTVAGREAIASADILVTDRLAPQATLLWARPDAEIIDVAKVPGGRATDQAEINRLLVEHAKSGQDVVRLKGGDSFVFGRGGEELLACHDAGIETRVVPGVTSATAAPASAGIPVTHRGLTQSFTVVSAHVPPGHEASTVDWHALARAGGTIVVLMGVGTLDAVAEALVEGGLDPGTPAAVVTDGALPSQQVVRADLAGIARAAEDAGVIAPAVTVVGDVAALDLLGERS